MGNYIETNTIFFCFLYKFEKDFKEKVLRESNNDTFKIGHCRGLTPAGK